MKNKKYKGYKVPFTPDTDPNKDKPWTVYTPHQTFIYFHTGQEMLAFLRLL